MILVILPPLLFALANIVDKLLVHGDEEDATPGALTALSAVFNAIAGLAVVAWIVWFDVPLPAGIPASVLILNGCLYVVAVWLYLRCLFVEDVSAVAPWFLTIPIFGLIGGAVVLSEIPSAVQLVAVCILLVCGWFLCSAHATSVAPQMLIASALFAGNDVVFAEYGRTIEPSCAVACDIWGKVLWCSLALVSPVARRGFVIGLTTRFKLQSVSELLTIAADAAMDVAKIAAPIVIVQAAGSLQPVFVLAFALMLRKRFASFKNEKLTPRKLALVIGMSASGGYLIYSTA